MAAAARSTASNRNTSRNDKAAPNSQRSTRLPVTKDKAAALPIRSASERRATLHLSGLLGHRKGPPSLSGVCLAPLSAAALPAKQLSTELCPGLTAEKKCPRKQSPVSPPIAHTKLDGIEEGQLLSSSHQQRQSSPAFFSGAYAPQPSTVRISILPTETAVAGPSSTSTHTRRDVATVAYHASRSVVPPQLLATLSAAAYPPSAAFPSPLYLDCRCCKNEGFGRVTVGAVETAGHISAATAAVASPRSTSLRADIREQHHDKRKAQHRRVAHAMSRNQGLQEINPDEYAANFARTVVAEQPLTNRGSQLKERGMCYSKWSKEVGDVASATADQGCKDNFPSQVSRAATGAGSGDLRFRKAAASLCSHRCRHFLSEDPCDEATAIVDDFSAALWRQMMRSSCDPILSTAYGGECTRHLLLQTGCNQEELRKDNHELNALQAVEQEERRQEHRDVRIIAGCLQAALVSVTSCAAAVHEMPSSALYRGCSYCSDRIVTTDSAHAGIPEEAKLHCVCTATARTVANTLGSSFCLPCAARKYMCNIPCLSLHSPAAACFIIPRRGRRPGASLDMKLTHSRYLARRCNEGSAAERSHSQPACEAPSTSTSDPECCGGKRRVDRNGFAVSATHCPRRRACRYDYRRELHRCGCRKGDININGKRCCASKRASDDWTCHAVYVHLGVLYTAADVAASATAAASGKASRDAKTAATAAWTSAAKSAASSCSITESESLGSVLLRRILLSKVTAPLRARLLLQPSNRDDVSRKLKIGGDLQNVRKPQKQMENKKWATCDTSAAGSMMPQQNLVKGHFPFIHLPAQKANNVNSTCPEMDSDVNCHEVLSDFEMNEGRPASTQKTIQEEWPIQKITDLRTEGIIVCCLDGIEKLHVCQWKQAARVLNSILSDAANTCIAHARTGGSIAHARGTLEGTEKTKTTAAECIEGSMVGVAPTEEPCGLANPTPFSKNTSAKPSDSYGAERMNRVIFLLLWRCDFLPSDVYTSGAVSTKTAAVVSNEHLLWEEIRTWQQQHMRQLRGGVQVVLVAGEDDVETGAYTTMLRYLTYGARHLCRREMQRYSAASTTEQKRLLDRGTYTGFDQLCIRHERRQDKKQDTESDVHLKVPGREGKACICSSNTGRQHREQSPKREEQRPVANPGSCRKFLQHIGRERRCYESEAGRGVRRVHSADEAPTLIKDSVSTTSVAVADEHSAILTKAETSPVKWRQRRVGGATDATRPEVKRVKEPKRTLRPCMLFLCGRSFMPGPMLSRRRSWRRIMSYLTEPMREFVRELETRVYIPMVLRSRIESKNSRGAHHDPLQSAAAAVWPATGLSSAGQDRRALLLEQCGRLLRWGDQLLPPPRLLVYSCDGTGKISRRGRSTSARAITAPLDVLWSPQQLLQLVGERYSRDVQTFLLPVAALASSYVGETEEKLRRLLWEAAAAAPAVLVLLGLDQLAARRQMKKLPTSMRLRAPTRQQKEGRQLPIGHSNGIIPQENVIRKLLQNDETTGKELQNGRLADFEEIHGKNARDPQGYEEPAGESLFAERVVSREEGCAKQENQAANTTSHRSRELKLCAGRHASEGDPSAAGSLYTGLPCTDESPDNETARHEDDASDEEEMRSGGRGGLAGSSALRRRLLAALLVGLDDIEDRRTCCPALHSLDDPFQTSVAEPFDRTFSADAAVTRHTSLQQAGLAVVGVCGCSPECLDEAVVRAGRLDLWLSWPHVSALKDKRES